MSLNISDLDQLVVDEPGAIPALSFDLAIIGFGKSTRHGYLLSQIGQTAATTIIAITTGPVDDQTVKRLKKQFDAAVVDSLQAEATILALADETARQDDRTLRVFVDVSCLSRTSMGRIFSALKEAAQVATVKLSVGYCLARYSPPPERRNPANRKVSPVHPTFSGWTAGPYRPVDVIVALGYEKGKALGAVEYLEPSRRWIFVPNSPETKFLRAVKAYNRELTSGDVGVPIDYEVLRPRDAYFSLLSLVVGLLSEARPVLLPFGPRIFFAISLLVAMAVEEAAIWHVDGDDDNSVDIQQPTGHAVIMSCLISSQ